MIVTYRPLPVWPYDPTRVRRGRYTFKAGWQDTLNKLEYEVGRLRGANVIIAAGFRDQDIRLDGMPRADAKAPSHPGIEVSFDSKYGRLVYATDVCEFWQHNVRSIALGLEALRDVDRYGVSKRGQQYAGWKALSSGTGGDGAPDTVDGAKKVLIAVVDVDDMNVVDDWQGLYRRAVKRTHPDQGGDGAIFRHVEVAGRILRQAGVMS